MKQEEIQLLLKDLSARLPYNPMVHIHDLNVTDYNNYLYADSLDSMMTYSITLKPYLRPMSSMTDEEMAERISILYELEGHIEEDVTYKYQDFLNAHHLDYRGLIPMGLAIKAPKDMYKL